MYIPDPRWEEPNLLIPGKKPVAPVVVDRSHPIGNDVAFSFLFQGEFGSATGGDQMRFSQESAASTLPSFNEHGLRMYADFGSGDDDRVRTLNSYPTLRSASDQPAQTLVIEYIPEPVSVNQKVDLLNGSDSLGFYIIRQGADNVWIGYQGGNGFAYLQTGLTDDEAWRIGELNRVVISASSLNTDSRFLFANINGQEFIGNSGSSNNVGGGTLTTSLVPFSLSPNSGTTNYYHYNGSIKSVTLIHNAYTQEGVNRLYADPYQFLIPA